MDNFVVWLIIIGFYTPLHFGLPVLVTLFTGTGSIAEQKPAIKKSLLDSLLSLVLAFALAITLVMNDMINWAMLALLLAMTFPVARVLLAPRATSKVITLPEND